MRPASAPERPATAATANQPSHRDLGWGSWRPRAGSRSGEASTSGGEAGVATGGGVAGGADQWAWVGAVLTDADLDPVRRSAQVRSPWSSENLPVPSRATTSARAASATL